jgi:hypothetical protein
MGVLTANCKTPETRNPISSHVLAVNGETHISQSLVMQLYAFFARDEILRTEENTEMGETRELVNRLRAGRVGFIIAAIVVMAGTLLIFLANYALSAAILGQALVAYVGVFMVAAGILYGASTLLIPA